MGVQCLIVAPDPPDRLTRYLSDHHIPVPAVADPSGQLLLQLGQPNQWMKLGRMPALLGVNATGAIVYEHFGKSMRDLPDLKRAASRTLEEVP